MPAAIKRADMRLVHVRQLLTWTRLRCYEELQPDDYLTLPYEATTDAMWGKTLLLSWRWSKEKPKRHIRGFSPMSQHQLAWLQAYLELQPAIQLVWIDWSCVPQYESSPMIEVGRSKVGRGGGWRDGRSGAG